METCPASFHDFGFHAGESRPFYIYIYQIPIQSGKSTNIFLMSYIYIFIYSLRGTGGQLGAELIAVTKSFLEQNLYKEGAYKHGVSEIMSW